MIDIDGLAQRIVDDIGVKEARGAWHDTRIHQWLSEGNCQPWHHVKVNPNSIDLSLSSYYFRPRWWWTNPVARKLVWPFLSEEKRDMRIKENHSLYWSDRIEFDKVTIWPGEFLLFSTFEQTKIPSDVCPLLFSKSTTGRMGLEHLHAGVGDAGFNGTWTLELKNMGPFPIILRPYERYFQIVFIDLAGKAENPYDGRYQNQGIYDKGPTPAREEKA